MNATTAFDPHLNITVPLGYFNINGSNTTSTFFNPYNFTQTYTGYFGQVPDERFTFANCVICYFPLSGSYCTLNRFLFLAEALFALGALLLDYVWLSSIAAAAVLNYTTVAAIHMIVLLCIPGNTSLDLDYGATTSIVINSLFFAYPLLQWSQLLRKKDYTNTRYIIGCWAVLICVCAAASEYGTTIPGQLLPVAEVFMDSGAEAAENFLSIARWYPDTVNARVIDIRQPPFQNRNLSIGPCLFAAPLIESSLRKGQSVVAAPDYLRFLFTNSFAGLLRAFAAYAVITAAATCCAVFHGKRTTRYVRGKMYLYIAGSAKQGWRHILAVLVTFFYYVIHFIVGIFSLPIAVVVFIIDEIEFEKYPGSDNGAFIGQWGPWVGAGLILVAAIMNESNIVMQLRDSMLWLLATSLAKLFPKTFSSPKKEFTFDMTLTLPKNIAHATKFIVRFFAEEFSNTFDWLRNPQESSKRCIDAEDADEVSNTAPPSPAVQMVATVPAKVYDPVPTFGLTGRQTWGMP